MNNQQKVKKVLSGIELDESFKDYEKNNMTGQVIWYFDSKTRVEILLFNGKIHSPFKPAIRIGKDIELYYLNGVRYNSKKSWEKACKSPSFQNEKMILKRESSLEPSSFTPKLPLSAPRAIHPEPKQAVKSDFDWTLSRHGVYAEREDG